ncbi:preprotein translocase subunit YajC [Staphylococcus massiliensis]|uniref:Preprotein translocase subunit YajC n=1 Tax=Staphylococcus massiliensis S46 TaxID=1229783 RepID=K9AV58_9STAP|nr:preprotein translocase subunit YajC [Staphylococcus massiliensis]EKU49976.1 preprotein translocase subunit YajC [Staphylococcus massiliensis S46]MCG3399079.1 preprotein translocase subunit YajC [Staphylococcus massiliensis]MCG3400923.1 preprotein translocase subunit YajC [Staphylococcus massiliensis]MCG3412460.1 preprotein translocase subunit YajC [Staphylococcus massiliensis]POA01758.1 preprotein translocase subunit YajC [Staphylococcus massiliensis CCUG 55927]
MGSLISIIPFLLLFVVMYFFMIRPQQKRQKEHREMVSQLEKGQRVTTIGGIKGTVRAVDETTAVISINGQGTEMTFEKGAIKQVDPS